VSQTHAILTYGLVAQSKEISNLPTVHYTNNMTPFNTLGQMFQNCPRQSFVHCTAYILVSTYYPFTKSYT